ncbi:hypothetical protein C7477_1141 [Phyllobacterium leguminum]|uniref:Uncharacterized protein n=1 Tax=Phyllobacterium leguminum TaxID=314237 RepID=A0A318T3I5_9HYPH|nr:hypothetical protein C7477_1141 [Phyllobacterium leguminum]
MTAGLNAEPRLSYIIELLRELFQLTDKTKFRVLAYIRKHPAWAVAAFGASGFGLRRLSII